MEFLTLIIILLGIILTGFGFTIGWMLRPTKKS